MHVICKVLWELLSLNKLNLENFTGKFIGIFKEQVFFFSYALQMVFEQGKRLM